MILLLISGQFTGEDMGVVFSNSLYRKNEDRLLILFMFYSLLLFRNLFLIIGYTVININMNNNNKFSYR